MYYINQLNQIIMTNTIARKTLKTVSGIELPHAYSYVVENSYKFALVYDFFNNERTFLNCVELFKTKESAERHTKGMKQPTFTNIRVEEIEKY